MELKEPRPKKNNRLVVSQPLPVIENTDGTIYKFTGYFDGYSVTVRNKDEMKTLNSMGCFGKGNFSRGYPLFNTPEDKTQFLRKRVFTQRKEWTTKFTIDRKPSKSVIVVPDSEDENDNYFTNLKVEYQMDLNLVEEKLHLSLEETFFLVSSIGRLNVKDENDSLLSEQKLWDLFCENDPYFIQNFVVYYYFRSRNWVVKPGIKFGGDFLLYKDGPPYYHASYIIIIDVLDSQSIQRREDMCRRSMSTIFVCGLNRLCETVGKELLICQLLWPSNLTTFQPEDISKISVNEVLLKRWISSQKREFDDF